MDPFSFTLMAGSELAASLFGGSEVVGAASDLVQTGVDAVSGVMSTLGIDTPSLSETISGESTIANTSGGGETISEVPQAAQPGVNTTLDTPTASSQSIGASTGGANVPQSVDFADNSFANTLSPDIQGQLTHKLTRVSTIEFSTSSNPFTDLVTIHLPQAYYVDYPQAPPTATAMFLRYVKTKFLAEVQVNAPMGCAGIVVVYFLPPGVNEQYDRLTVFNSPHVVMDIARQSTARLVVPYAAVTPFVPVNSRDMGSLRIMPLTPYRAPTGSSPSVTFVTYLAAVESNLSCPRPRRQMFSQISTNPEYIIPVTPGSLNLANSVVSSRTQTLSVAGEGFRVDHTTPGGQKPIVDFKWLAMRPGSRTDKWWFDWLPTQTAETRIFAWNIDMGQSVGTIGMVANSFAYARGSINITVLVAASVFNQGRLRITLEPSGEEDYDNQASMAVFYTLLDISKSNSVTLTVPYMSLSWFRLLTGQTWARLAVFVNNPLTYNATSIDSVRVGIFLSFAQDVELYVPHSNTVVYHSPPPLPSQVTDPFGPQVALTDLTQGVVTPQPVPETHRMFNSSHSNVDNLFGRLWFVSDQAIAQNTVELFPVPFPASTHAAIARSMAFWNGEPVFAIVNPNPFPVEVTHVWDDLLLLTPAALCSHGSIIVPAQGNVMFSVPFYSSTPVRSTDLDASLGNLVFRTMNSDHTGQMTLYAGLRSANFFFPRPVPTWIPPSYSGPISSYRATLGMLTARGQMGAAQIPSAVTRLMAAAANAQSPNDGGGYGRWYYHSGCYERAFNRSPILAGLRVIACRWRGGNYSRTHCLFCGLPRNVNLHQLLLLLSGDVELNPGPCVLVHDPLNNDYYVEVAGMFLAIKWPKNKEKLVKKCMKKKAGSVCRWPKTDKCPRYSFWSPPPQSWYIYGPTIYDWIVSDYFPCQPNLALCIHGLTTVEDPKVHVVLDGYFLPLSRLARVDVPMLASWMLAMAPKWFYGLPFTVPKAPPILPPELRQPIAQRMADIAAAASSALPQGPMDWLASWFDTYALKATLRNYAPTLIRAAINLYAIHVAKDPTVTLLLGGMIMYDFSTNKAPSAVVTLLEALSCGTWDAVKAVITPLFLEIPSSAWRRIHAAFTRLCVRAQAPTLKTVTDLAKNLIWWITAIGKLLQYIWITYINPPVQDQEVQLAIADVLINANALLAEASLNPKLPVLAKKREDVLTKLHYVLKVPGLPQEASRLAQNAFQKITQLQVAPAPQKPLRCEPVGVWISGEPGTGKSLLMSALSTDLAKHYGWTIYSHPTGSDHFDLYNTQEIHIIDDLGQNKEEKDLKVICQCISTVPFIVPIADLEGKGTWYNGKVVLATTNRGDFNCYTLTTPGALERRFPLRVVVEKSPWSLNKKSFEDRSFFSIKSPTGTPVRYDTLLQSIISAIDARAALAQSPISQEGTSVDPDPTVTLVENEIGLEQDTPAHHDSWWRGVLGGVLAVDPVLPFLSDTQRDAHVQDLAARLFSVVPARKIPDWVGYAFGAAGVFCAVRALISSVSSWLGNAHPVQGAGDAREQGPYNPSGSAVRVSARELARKADPQSPWSSPYHHLFKHTAFIRLPTGNFFFCAVSGRTIITNSHMYKDYPDEFTLCTLLGEFRVEKSKLVTRTDGDLTYAYCKQIPPHKHISSVPEIPQGSKAMLLFATPEGNFIQSVEKYAWFSNVVFWHGTQVLAHTYSVSTRPGMCGGLLIVLHQGNWYPVGIHMAGTPSQGFAAGFLNNFLTESARAQGRIISCTEVPRFTLGFCPKTKYIPSPVSIVVESDLAPAPLSAFDSRLEVKRESNSLFLLEKFRKYDRDVSCTNPDLLRAIADEYFAKLQQLFPRPAKPVSIEVAVFDTVTPMDHRSSAGPKYPGIKRSELIDFGKKEISDQLRHDVNTLIEELCEGKTDGVVFSSFFKDELRTWDKIRAGDTRVVECSSLDYTVAFRMQFLEVLLVLYQSDPLDTGIAPGMNVYTEMYPLVASLYKYNLCLDFKKYDSRLSTEIMVQAARVLSDLTEDPSASMNFFYPIIRSYHQVASHDVVVMGGMPSGCPITAVYNSVCNVLMMTYGVLKCNPDALFVTVAYGDDNIVSIDQEIDLEKFTKTLSLEFGLEPTAPDKSLNFQFCTPPEVIFLKRTMRNTPEYPIPVPVLPLDNMLSRICWCKGRQEFMDQLRSFVIELALYGRFTYERVQQALLPAANLPPWSYSYRAASQVLGLADMTHNTVFSFYKPCPKTPPLSASYRWLTEMCEKIPFPSDFPE
uniref:Genome polyprotein n=1 Tax=Auskunsag virus TaxID=3003848 RepID=A0AA49I9I6_9VIRU|nr:MAG: polyprotein [Auskunsag virus]